MEKLILLFFFLCQIVEGQELNSSKMNELFNSLETNNELMGTISITEKGKEVYFKPLGFANVVAEKIANRNTKYRIGSITKTFTAVIILQLIDEGKLSLGTTLSKYFPKIPNASKITIEDLLRHQSGLFNITQQKDIKKWASKPQSRKQMLARFIKNGTVFEPKASMEYSNTNYILLSYIAEEIEKKSYASILRDKIIIPLKLKRTEFGKMINSKNNEAFSYYFENKKWHKNEKQTDMSVPMGAGSITATTTDLTKFYNALFNDSLISKKLLKQMTTTFGNFGLGISELQFKGMKIFGHAGSIDGFQSYALFIPRKKVAIAITTNALNKGILSVVIKVLEAYFENDKTLQSSSGIILTSKDLDQYLGVYSGKVFPAKVTFTKKGNTLFAQATGQPIFKLLPIKKDVFKYDSMGIIFKFSKQSKEMRINIGGKEHLLTKE